MKIKYYIRLEASKMTINKIIPFYIVSFMLCIINVAQAQNIAQQAAAILEHSCDTCHGEGGSFKAILDIEYSALLESGTVIVGDPEASELYKRLLGPTEKGGQMPQGQDPLSPEHIAIIRQWITEGAQNWNVTEADRVFISQKALLDRIRDHIDTLPISDRPYARYFSITHLYNAGVPQYILSEYQRALSKLVNSLSWGSTIFNPEPVDAQQTIFYIDLRYYLWENSDAWTHIEEEYPYHLPFEAENQTELKDTLTHLQLNMSCDIPHVHVDWFIANASLPPLYHDILNLPETDLVLEERLGVDVADNINNAPGRLVWRAGFNDSGVSTNNRVVERHSSIYGAYWKSYDFAASVGRKDIYTFPTAFDHDGGEVVFSLPNGLQAYYLSDAQGNRLDVAPIEIVSNPSASEPSVKNGLSCIGCHDQGMKEFTDTVRQAIEQTPDPLYDKEHALRLYTEQAVMDRLIEQDAQRYQNALRQTGGTIGGIEPVQRFHEQYHKRVDVHYAAATLGLQTETLILKIQEITDLQALGMNVLVSEGVIKRDTWVSNFSSVISTLYPTPEIVIPIDPTPETNPDDIVHFPDPNLHAFIAKIFAKPATGLITVAEMTSLEGSLDFAARGIQDLTGLEYAINITNLDMENNLISDLTPISRLTQLKSLTIKRNNVSDLTPISGLINLNVIGLAHNPLTNSALSAISNLVNMKQIGMSGLSLVTDLEFLSKFKLTSFSVWGSPITDITPLMNSADTLTHLNICGSELYDNISILQNFTNLKTLYLEENHISDISVLPKLTNLTRLHIGQNNITDVSPLSEMTHLQWIGMRINPIEDYSVLDALFTNGTKIVPNGFFFETDKQEIELLDTFVFNINALFINNLTGWQCNITFDTEYLEAVEVIEGDFLRKDGSDTFFQEGIIDNQNGIISGFNVLRLNATGVSGSGTLLSITFKAKKLGSTVFKSGSCYLGSHLGEEIPSADFKETLKIQIVEKPEVFTGADEDVNMDGSINILDMILVARELGTSSVENSRADVNGDGSVNILDLTQVANKVGEESQQ